MSEETTPTTELQDLAAQALARLEPDKVGPVADYIVHLETERDDYASQLVSSATLISMAGDELHDAKRELGEAREVGQREDGRLVFQVAVRGVGAKPYSPERLAHELCARWTEWMWQVYGPLASVKVEYPRAALAPKEPGEKEQEGNGE